MEAEVTEHPSGDWEANETLRNILIQMTMGEEDEQMTKEDADYTRNARVSMPIIMGVCFLGLLFNASNILVLTRKRMASSTAMLLTGLAVADMAAVLVELSNTMDKYVYLGQPQHFLTLGRVVFSIIHYCLFSTVSTISNWMTVVIGTWRFIAVTWPLQARQWCTKERARTAIIATFVMSVVLCTPIFLCFKLERQEVEGELRFDVITSDLALRHKGLLVKIVWGVLIFSRLVPCLILTVITACLIRNLCQAGHVRRSLRSIRREDDPASMSERTTAMLLVVLLLFLVSNLPFAIFNLLHTFLGEEFFFEVYLILFDILQLCVLVNHSINFVVYCFLSQNFRKTLLQIAPTVRKFSITNASFKSSSTTKV